MPSEVCFPAWGHRSENIKCEGCPGPGLGRQVSHYHEEVYAFARLEDLSKKVMWLHTVVSLTHLPLSVPGVYCFSSMFIDAFSPCCQMWVRGEFPCSHLQERRTECVVSRASVLHALPRACCLSVWTFVLTRDFFSVIATGLTGLCSCLRSFCTTITMPWAEHTLRVGRQVQFAQVCATLYTDVTFRGSSSLY